ncbi:MAG: hypothetical protein ACI3ZN_08565 [Candidatus Cryptobacteroides sp.]
MRQILYKTALLSAAAIFAVGCMDKIDTTSISLSSNDENVTVSENGMNADVVISPEGGKATIEIACSSSWRLIDDSSEASFDVDIDGNKVTISADEIISDHAYTALYRIVAGVNTWAYINVSQRGSALTSLSLDQKVLSFPEWGGVKEISVATNKDWRVEGADQYSWLEIEEDKDNNVVRVKTTTNTVHSVLEASLTVVAGTEVNSYSVPFDVIQDEWHEAFFSFTVDKATLPSVGGRTTIPVSSNRAWTAVSDQDWLKIENIDNSLTLSCEASDELKSAHLILTTEAQEGETPFTTELDVRTADKPMILKYVIPETYEGKMSVPVMAPFDLYIDWGDGTDGDIAASRGNGAFTRPDHKYLNPGEYLVKVYGDCGGMNSRGGQGIENIVEIVDWGEMGITNFFYGFTGTGLTKLPANTKDILANATKIDFMFMDCANLEEIPADLFSELNLTSISAVFRGCTSLKNIPETLFVGAEELKTMSAMFMGTGIESVPEKLLYPLTELTQILTMFDSCTNLSAVPENFFSKNTKLQRLRSIFYGTSVSVIPENLFANNPNLVECSSMFGNTLIKTIPENLFANNPKLNTIDQFCAYTKIETVPAGLFAKLPELSSVGSLFLGCTSLKNVPVSIFDNNFKLSTVTNAFALCTELEGESPYTIVKREVDGETVDVKVHLYERNAKDSSYQRLYPEFGEISRWGFESCFGGCTKLTDYDQIATYDYGKWVKVPNIW